MADCWACRRWWKIGNGFLLNCHFSWNLAYKIYKVGIFPKLVAGKCPTIFNKAQFGINFSWWLSRYTRGVTRDFPGNEMSFHWNYSTMLKNLGNHILYDCSQWVRGFKNCINHFSRCPQCREHAWNAAIFGIITPHWKIRKIAYPMIGPHE